MRAVLSGGPHWAPTRPALSGWFDFLVKFLLQIDQNRWLFVLISIHQMVSETSWRDVKDSDQEQRRCLGLGAIMPLSQLNSLGKDLESRALPKSGTVCSLFPCICLLSARRSSFSLASVCAALGPVGLWAPVGSPGTALVHT